MQKEGVILHKYHLFVSVKLTKKLLFALKIIKSYKF